MAEETPTSEKVARSGEGRQMPGRFGIALNVLVQMVLVLAIFLGVNLLSYRYYWRQDLSPVESYTLSSSSLSYLRKLSKEVEMTVVFVRGSPLYEYLQALTEEYRRNGKKLVKVTFVDPTRDLERTEQLKAENGLTLDQSGILIKANKRSRFIKEEELIITTTEADRENPRVDLRGEDAITSALDGLIAGEEKKIYLVAGKGARVEADVETVLQALAELGRQQNFSVKALNLAQALPDDADGIVFGGIKYDLSDRELSMINDYWLRKRAGMLFLLDPSADTPKLDAFLASTGIQPRGDRVLYAESTASGPRKQFSVDAAFAKETVITRALQDAFTNLSGQSQSLALATDNQQLREQAVSLQPLVVAGGRYWGEKDYLSELPLVGDGDTLPPVVLAASAERGAVADERLRVDSSRIVVVGNATLLDPRTRLSTNQDFLSACLNWMMNRERLIGITPKARPLYRIQLTPKQHDLIFWVTGLLAPLLVLVLGLSVWSSRRAS